ncbi:MAG TPA: PEP-CTERM sorting domain-containing protein [Terriglobales bacterium]|nr:PEP-CTERM sorting domain-containing protein [Terriglobales bacterium]
MRRLVLSVCLLVVSGVGASASSFSYSITGSYDSGPFTDPNNVVIAGDSFSLGFSNIPSPLPQATIPTITGVPLIYSVDGTSITGLIATIQFIPFIVGDFSTGLFDILVSDFNGFDYEWGFTGAAAFDQNNFQLFALNGVPVNLDNSSIIVTNSSNSQDFTFGGFQEGTVVNAAEVPVPEPSSLLMLASGLAATIGAVRRRLLR